LPSLAPETRFPRADGGSIMRLEEDLVRGWDLRCDRAGRILLLNPKCSLHHNNVLTGGHLDAII